MYPTYYNPQIRAGGHENDQDHLNWEWYSPPEDCIGVNFCRDTSLHGLHYLGQPKRHIFERIFWFVAVSAAIGTAGYLIWGMYSMNRDMPIVTVFGSTETTIDEIPFPAVTICNVNNIQKSKFDDAYSTGRLALLGLLSEKGNNAALAKFLDMYYICEGGNTFTDKFVEGGALGEVGEYVKGVLANETHNFEKLVNPRKTLAESSQPCKEMLLYCIWLGEIRDCSDLFQEVETDYGYCCTFNLIPMSLLVRSDDRDDPVRVAEWKKLNITYDTLMFTEKTKNRKYPFRQRYPGREAGLSVFLDPDLDEYQCTNTDSKGFVLGLDTPLDFPRIKDHGISIPNGSEVLISIRPQITMTDKSVENFSLKKRRCYFDNNYKLPHYSKYTTSNCLDECIAEKTKEECGCLRYYMPHSTDGHNRDKICRPVDYKCVEDVRRKIYQDGLGQACEFCLPTCTKIEYQTESTFLTVIDDKVERLFNRSAGDRIAKHVFKHNNSHHPSIVHVYFGVDSAYPRLRTESTSYSQLISNAGGILGLCLGFSVLSALEIVYYITIRLGCNWYRERTLGRIRRNMVVEYEHATAATAMKFQMMNASKGGNYPPGSDMNRHQHQHQPRYNTLFEKWTV